MKILHVMSSGTIGGIEMLCKDIAGLSCHTNEFAFLFSGGPLKEQMEQQGISTYTLYQRCKLQRFFLLYRLVKRQQYDVVVVHHEGRGIYCYYLFLTIMCKDVHFIKYLHSSFEEKYFYIHGRLGNWIDENILRLVLARSERLVAVSKYAGKSYEPRFPFVAKKVIVIYNGIGFKGCNRNLDFSSPALHLLYVGRLVEVKGIDLMLYAVKYLLEHELDVKLTIVGDGEQRAKYEKMAVTLGVQDHITFTGFQMEKEKYYQDVQVFIYPSVWQEAFGISIIEAMSRGLICVASSVGGIPEIITDGENGFLFQPQEQDALGKVLLQLLKGYSVDKLDVISKQAIHTATKYGIEQMVQQYDKSLLM